MMIMKRILYLLIIPTLLLLVACHKEKDREEEDPTHFGRTVMVYMAMQNSLGSSGFHKSDSTEIVNAMSYIPAGDRLLLFIDDARKPRLYELKSSLAATDAQTGKPYGPRLIKTWETDVSSASAATVTEVLTYMRTKYDSDSYGLVMGSHATGWLPTDRSTSSNNSPRREDADDAPDMVKAKRRKTFGIDVGPDGSMSSDHGVAGSVADQIEIDDLAKAISESGVHLDFLLFDACLMQNVEVDYALRNVTDYVIASPISISAEGGYYTDLVRYGFFSGDVVDVARTYASYYLDQGSIPYRDNYGTVISCVRTSAMARLTTTMQQLLDELIPAFDGDERVALMKSCKLDDALYYHTYCSNYYWRPHYYDIVSAIKALGANEEQMQQLRRALDEAIAYKGANDAFWIGPGYFKFMTMPTSEQDWCGISMFVPRQEYTSNLSRCPFGDLNEAFKGTGWYREVFDHQ